MSNFQFQTLAFLDNNRNRKAAAGQAVCGVTHIAGPTAVVGVGLLLSKCHLLMLDQTTLIVQSDSKG